MAVYNVLKYLNRFIPFARLIYYFEKQNLLFGVFGAWPGHLKELFNLLGINYYLTYDKNDLDKFDVSRYDAIIPTYFHKKFDIEGNETDDFGFGNVKKFLVAHTTFMQKVVKYICISPNKEPQIIHNKFIEVNNRDEEVEFTNLTEKIKKDPDSNEKVLISCFGLKS